MTARYVEDIARHDTRRMLVRGRWIPMTRLVKLHPLLAWPNLAERDRLAKRNPPRQRA